MDALFENISELWNGLSQMFFVVYDYLFNLCSRLDSVTFTTDSTLTTWFGMMRFLMGDTVYLVFTSLMTIGASFLIYKLFKKLFNFVISHIPGISGGAI